MAAKVRTPEGKALYARRKVIVEPVFGQIKEDRGFRRFLLRGLEEDSRRVVAGVFDPQSAQGLALWVCAEGGLSRQGGGGVRDQIAFLKEPAPLKGALV
jgi:hypothetical protein